MSGADSGKTPFERALAESGAQKVQLRLFIAGMTPRSTEAVADLKRLAAEFLGPNCAVEIVDLYEHPEAAGDAQVVAVPTLLRTSPLPQRKLIGSLRNIANVASKLGLTRRLPASPE